MIIKTQFTNLEKLKAMKFFNRTKQSKEISCNANLLKKEDKRTIGKSERLLAIYHRMKSVNIQVVSISLLLMISLNSCFDEIFIEGNGIKRSEFRMAEGFKEISSNGDFYITVIPSDKYSVEIIAESNLLPYIDAHVNGKTLKLKTQGISTLQENLPIEIIIHTPALSGLSLSGSGYIKTGYFNSDDFNVAVSGSGDINLKVSASEIKAAVSGSGIINIDGDCIDTDFVISGSGKIRAYDLLQKRCEAKISGSGDMYINASQSIDATISGSGRVYYLNNPTIKLSVSGSGGIVRK